MGRSKGRGKGGGAKAAQAAADKGSEALVLRGGDVEVIGPLADTAVPVLRELPFATTTNVDDLDTDAFACKTLGYAGVLLASQAQSPVGALSEALGVAPWPAGAGSL